MNKKLQGIAFLIPLIPLILLTTCQSETTTIQTKEGQVEINSVELLQTIGEAYVFGYPLVLMDLTKRVSTNIEQPHPTRARAPINQLGHYRNFPDHTMKAVVKPNVDTYYTIAWFDLEAEPQVLFMPATDRYYLLPFYDAYSNVFATPGTRTTGTGAHTFLITGPNWKGDTPNGMQLLQAPTNMVWMIGRIQVNSTEDGATTVKAIQDGMKLIPLSAYGQEDYTPPIVERNPEQQDVIPVKTVREIDISTYLNRVAQLLVTNPPKAADSLMLKKMAKIGLVPGQPFELSTDNLIVKTKLGALPEFIHKRMETRRANPDPNILSNGWTLIKEGIGEYGTDYSRRAYIDFVGLGANLPEDSAYPSSIFDINGDPLEASKPYQLHFEAGQLPPVNAFWSITAYNADDFLVENKWNRFALGDRDDLKYNKDGSLDVYSQTNPPKEEYFSNWLPIPKEGKFTLTLRLYWPKEEVRNGGWKPPHVIPVEREMSK